MAGRDREGPTVQEINLTGKVLMVLPKNSLWTWDTIQKTVRTLSLSLALAVGILLINLFLLPLITTYEPFLLFFPAIAFIGWYMGYRSGMLMIAISALLINYFLLRPQYTWIHPIPETVQLGLFIAGAVLMNYLIEKSKHPAIVREFHEREKEYQQLIMKLHKEYIAAKEEIRSRDEFLSIASHELKTPLTSMLLQLQTALHNIRNVSLANFSVENLLKMLDSAEQQSKRLAKMINDLLNVSLMTTGRLDLEKEEMDLNQTVKDCVERFSEKAKKDGIKLTFSGDGKLLGTWDKLRIEQAVSNLLTNAIKYGNGNPIDVHVMKQNGRAKISVRDHGIGIPKAKLAKIFTRFERAVDKRSFEGLGVGLYLSQQIIETHGGKIIVESKEAHGSTFTIILPLKN